MTISTSFRNHLIQGLTVFALGTAASSSLAAIDDGRYQILSRYSGLALDVAGNSTSNGANVQQWEAQGDNARNQHFDVTDLGNGYYAIRPAHSGKSIDVDGWSTEPGGEIRQWRWNGGPQQQWRIEESGNGYYRILSRHSGLALDVWEWSSNNGGDIRQWTDTGNANQQWRFVEVGSAPGDGTPGDGDADPDQPGTSNPTACLGDPVGYASLGGGTTGGAGGTTVTVSTGKQLLDALSNKGDNTPLTILVDGTINLPNSGASKLDVKDISDVSIIGVGNRGVLDGIGIKIWRASNIIVRNLTIRHVREGDGDGISIEGPSSNVWIDHNTIYNSLDVDKDYYDGLVDIKKDANNISITWNHLHDSWKTALAGHSDNDSNNNRRITYAFNLWENTYSRTPLNRFGDTHIYNNYYRNILDTGINSRMGAQVRIDNNVFESSRNPIVSCYSDQIGYWDTRGNEFIDVEWESANDCVIAGPGVSSTTSFTPPYPYDLLPTRAVREQVAGNAGAGRCEL
ncbi:RICIN domain-containing protein [Marinobacter sp.]|uniref:RICIN domain-containing protein n=1 Tax=Marinobacter sp. TaxID=50741 RepID=UPI003568C2DB